MEEKKEQEKFSEPISHENKDTIKIRKPNLNTWKILTVVFALLLVFAVVTKGFSLIGLTGLTVLSVDDAKDKIDQFVQENFATEGVIITIDDITEESGLYKIDLTANYLGKTEKAVSYLSKDGKLFFVQGINIDEFNALKAQLAENTQQIPIDVVLDEETTTT